jgi:hypothetical protein
METTKQTLEQVLEEGAVYFPEIEALYQWSNNYEAGKTPFTLLLDLIGYSAEQYGAPLYDLSKPQLGYLELDYLGDALKEYADKGGNAHDFIERILEAEASE